MGEETHCVEKERVFNLLERNKELEAEVSRLTEENKRLEADAVWQNGENQHLKISIEAIDEENAKLKARIAELEESLQINGKILAKKNVEIVELNDNLKPRIAAIEKWLADWSVGVGRARFPFKPGGEGVPVEKGEGEAWK